MAGFATTLTASALWLAVSGDRPAQACHIHHDSATAHSSESTAGPMTLAQALRNFANPMHDQAMLPTPETVTPAVTPTSGMTHPAAEYLMPPPVAAPQTVQNWQPPMPAVCTTPPPPPTAMGGTTAQPSGQSLVPSPAPAALSIGSPAPTPEPSTIVIALALGGVFAWRRRAARTPR